MLTESIETLIPHRGIMLLIDRVVRADENSIETEYTPQAEAWYADAQGNMPTWVGMELMAQTIAAWVGWLKQKQGLPPKRGVLLGTRHYKAETPVFKQGEPLRIHVSLVYRDDSGLGAYECAILEGEETRALAMLKVFEPEDFEAFHKGEHA